MRRWLGTLTVGARLAARCAVYRAVLAGVACGALLAGAAHGQTPSTKIGTAALVSPSAVQAGYSETISPNPPDIPVAVTARSQEIKLLAAALGHKRAPDAFVLETFNYVHNNIRIAWMFGLQKGGLGAIIDRSGTAFDQADLMVEVLREGGVTAVYQYGTITLGKAQFAAWSGITKATAACQLLSSGGIPATINGSVDAGCGYGTADVDTITLSHAWVKVSINDTEYAFDPAYKAYDWKAADATLAGRVAAGGALAAAAGPAAADTYNGAQYVQGLSASALGDVLRDYATSIQCRIEGGVVANQSCNEAGAHADHAVEDVVGGGQIRREYRDVMPPATLAYGAVARTWDGLVPDDFRTKLRVKVERCPYPSTCGQSDVDRITLFDAPLFVDDIYGRKLIVIARDHPDLDGGPDDDKDVLRLVDEFGNFITLASKAPPSGIGLDKPMYNDAKISLSVDHPYPTAAGAPSAAGYMDATVVKKVFMWMPLVIVHGWGDTGKGLVDKWGAREDSQAPWYAVSQTGCDDTNQGCNYYPPSSGDGRREQLAAGWLSQSARAAQLHAALADARYTHHHSIGVASAQTSITTLYYGQTAQILGYSAADSFDRIDIDTAFSLTSLTNDAARRRAAVHAIAETLEVLEGSVMAHVADMPDTASVAARFAWASAGAGYEDRPFEPGAPAAARRFLSIGAPLTAGQATLLKVDGQQTSAYDSNDGVHDQNTPEMSPSEASAFHDDLLGAVNAYAALGFNVVTSEEAFLGPGQKAGPFRKNGQMFITWTHYRSRQRGGALIATKYDGADPVEIAHVVVGEDHRSKGGGGGAQAGHQNQYDPKKAADVLKTRFVDRSRAVGVDLLSGQVTYSSPAKLDVGQGGFPDRLTAEIFWRGGEFRTNVFSPPGHTEPQTPWSTNWHNQLSVSGSGMEAMGLTDVRATGATIAAFLAMQDVYRAAPSAQREATAALVGAWWVKTLVHNVVTVNVGAKTEQFVRRFDGVWFAPGGDSYAVLTQTGEPAIYTNKCGGGAPAYVPTRGWNYAPVAFSVRNANGDVQTFPYYEKKLRDGAFCMDTHGFRMTSWSFPKGVTVNLTYSNDPNGHDYLTGVSNTLGRQLTFTYNGTWVSGVSDGTRSISVTSDVDGRVVHTDANGKMTKFAVGVGANRYQLAKVFAADEPDPSDQHGALEYSYDGMGRVSFARDRLAARGNRKPHTFLLAHGLKGERLDPMEARYSVDYDDDKHPVRFVDELKRVTTAAYDGRGRVIAYTYPEGDQETLGYDDHNNPTIMIRIAKPLSLEAGAPIVVKGEWDPSWNKPTKIIDAKGQPTILTYHPLGAPGAGELWQAFRPAVDGGTPTYTFAYNGVGQLITSTDPTGLVTALGYDANRYLQTTTVEPNGLNLVTTLTNNILGDPVDINGPRLDVADVSHVTYDAMRRKLIEIGPDPGTGKATAKRTTYDNVGRPWKTEQGYMSAGAFVPVIASTLEFDPVGNKIKETTPAGITQFSYDDLDRVLCTAKRMSAATDPNACQLTAAAAPDLGPDQISANDYDEAGQLEQTRIGVGTTGGALPIGTRFVEYKYSPNGQKVSVKDGSGNLTLLEYDGFDRLKTQFFPRKEPKGSGQHDPNDYESYRYDPNGNRVSLRKRDGQTFIFDVDANDRMTRKIVDGKPEQNVRYAYDLAGRIASSVFDATSQGIVYGYDSAKRLTSETSDGRIVGFELDKAGNRTGMTWPGGTPIEYVYDAANRLTKVREPGATSGLGLLADIHYDDLGRRKDLIRGNGGRTDYTYDAAGRLETLSQTGNPASTAPQPTLQTISYTPASQIRSLLQTNLNYVWTGHPPFGDEAHDGQNRIASLVALDGYDRNGNLTKAKQRTYAYDPENRLTQATLAGVTMDLTYDPSGRLRSTQSNGTTTYYLYAADKLVAEYATPASGEAPLRRYVHGDGADEPLVWYENAGYAGRTWLHADRQGSIIGASNSAGELVTQTYGPWGETDNWAGPRFRYTGQAALPDVQLYHYKARAYDPVLGRFLQTDPIGQEDDPNLYAYVKDDPTNKTDPTGTQVAGAEAYGLAQDIMDQSGGDQKVMSKMAGDIFMQRLMGAGGTVAFFANPVLTTRAMLIGAGVNGGAAKLTGKSDREAVVEGAKGAYGAAGTAFGAGAATLAKLPKAAGEVPAAYASTKVTGGSNTEASVAATGAFAGRVVFNSGTIGAALARATYKAMIKRENQSAVEKEKK